MPITPAMELMLEDIATKPVPTELVNVSPDLAQHWLDRYLYENQRPLRQFNVARLAEAMLIGSFKLSEIKFVVTPDGTFYLINGQHRLHAVLMYGKEVLFQITVLTVANKQEVNEYYSAEDRGLGRSLVDTYQAMNLGEELGVPRSILSPMSAALVYIESELNNYRAQQTRKNLTDAVRVKLIREWKSEIQTLQGYAPRGGKNRISATYWVNTALAVQLITLRYRGEQAKDFWSKVISQEGLMRGTPEFGLFQYCQTRSKIAGIHEQDHVARAFALAWGHHFRGSKTFVIQTGRMNFSNPYAIAGTPYTGNQWGLDPKWKEGTN